MGEIELKNGKAYHGSLVESNYLPNLNHRGPFYKLSYEPENGYNKEDVWMGKKDWNDLGKWFMYDVFTNEKTLFKDPDNHLLVMNLYIFPFLTVK